MDAFMEQLRVLQTHFDALSSEQHKDALAAVAEAVTSMKDASVRRRFEKEVELTLAWEAEKMIVERFAGESSLTGLYDEPSTSGFGFEAVPSIFDAGDEFTWAHSEVEHQPETHLQPRVLNQQAVEYSYERHGDSTEQSALSEVAIDAAMTSRTTSEQVSAASDVITSRSPGKENRFNCATCGYQGNNRKALYRHGVKTGHLLRTPQYSGSKSCKLCPFRTNKTFSLNRHMRRFHSPK
ncbi:unnamed protein product [Cylicocyclus nassatus]|uniref:C2H2-type domain-containing protein n=1 Tax=Cylicocyclus nassatus TaxID=53992 RepID=A0AA36GCU5_CYLNA|nr:unnamed protein product [Cylicocyclus nassatus]